MRPSRLYRTVVTASGADIAENQERRGSGIPTFPPVRTTSLFADRVQLEPFHGLFDIEIVRTGSSSDFEPGRKAQSVVR